MKKKIIALVAAFACIILSISAVQPVSANAVDLVETYNKLIDVYNRLFGDETNVTVNNNVNEVKDKVNSIDVDQSLDNYFSQINVDDNSEASKALTVPAAFAEVTDTLWAYIIFSLSSYSTGTKLSETRSLVLQPDDPKYADIVNIMRTLGYALVLVFFAVNIIEQTIKFEIFTVKGMLQIFGRLILAKIIIDLSVTICMAIVGVCGSICSQILTEDFKVVTSVMPSVNLATSGIKVIGPIIDFLVTGILCLAISIIVLSVMVATGFVIIKLTLRSIELTLLVTVSPAFFACISSDVTRPYFRNFILTFIQVSAQIIFMAIVLFIGSTHLQTEIIEITDFIQLIDWCGSVLPNVILIIAMCIMMVKPPKVLTNLIK